MAGEWKTIEQRERTQSRARRTQRRGIASAVVGGGLLAAVETHRPGGVLMTGRLLRRTMGPKARKYVHPEIRRDALKTAYMADPSTMLGSAAGSALVGGGVAGYTQGRVREAYQQRRINARRKANASRAMEKSVIGSVLRRRKKVPGPVIRVGRARLGRPGVEYSHQGTTGWGTSESAAHAAWEQNRSSVGKRGLNPHPDQPRYGGGGGHGRRVIEKSAAGSPAGRKPTLARKTGQAPAGGQARQPMAALAAPQAPVLARRPITGIVPLTTQSPAPVAKADRYFDPEDRRQRRRGLSAGALGLGGGYFTGTGGRDVVRHVRAQNDPGFRAEMDRLPKHIRPGVGLERRVGPVLRAVGQRKATVVHHGTTGRVAGGLALLGASGAVLRRSDDPRKRRWN